MGNMQELTPYETREILFYKTDNGEVRVEILLFQEIVQRRCRYRRNCRHFS